MCCLHVVGVADFCLLSVPFIDLSRMVSSPFLLLDVALSTGAFAIKPPLDGLSLLSHTSVFGCDTPTIGCVPIVGSFSQHLGIIGHHHFPSNLCFTFLPENFDSS